MNTHQIQLTGIAMIAVAFIGDQVVDRINSKRFERNLELARELETENEILRAALSTSCNKISYLSTMLDEHDVPITEFDIIAFNQLT